MRYFVPLLVAAVAHAAVVTENISFRTSQFDVAHRDAYSVVLGEGMGVSDEPGAPQLPVMPVAVNLPGRGRVTGVSVFAKGWVEYRSDVSVFPAQHQVPLSWQEENAGFTAPDPAIYGAAQPYPAVPAVWTGVGIHRENTAAELLVYPLRYVGSTGRLEMCTGIRIEVEYEPLPPAPSLDLDAFDYVIVTSATYDSIFRRLAEWKTQKGIRTVTRDIAWILGAFPGRDDAEKLRSYLQALPDSGVEYVLLGGDVSVVPFRKAFAMISEGNLHEREDSLPCDLYFADLDGDWDADGDGVFGEVADSVDLYPDLVVGRAPG